LAAEFTKFRRILNDQLEKRRGCEWWRYSL